MTPEETQREGIASLIAMLELMMLLASQVIITGYSWCTVLFFGHWTHSWLF